MTPFRNRINQATKRMAEDMLIRNMAVRTIDSYTYHVDRFAKHFGKPPEDLGHASSVMARSVLRSGSSRLGRKLMANHRSCNLSLHPDAFHMATDLSWITPTVSPMQTNQSSPRHTFDSGPGQEISLHLPRTAR